MPSGEGGLHGGEWTRAYFMSRAASIYGGTYDIQRNIIAERMFGLPR
jgi:alkylation response protein AidB-like acyl-CoA dehydrogenase